MSKDDDLFTAWRAADDRLSSELKRLFGKRAGDARYDATHKDWSDEAVAAGEEFVRLGELVNAYWRRRNAAENAALVMAAECRKAART